MPKIKIKGLEGLNQLAQPLGITLENNEQSKGGQADFTPEEIPRMYRAQIDDRCSLQFAGRDNKHLERWREEWIDSQASNTPRYQNKEPNLGIDGSIFRIKIKFPFRLFSNCGQDNILRPIMGKNGIPFLSGSSVKGLFRRACDDAQKEKYCGDDKNLAPSSLGLRFHGAYPIGDWSGSHGNGQNVKYRMLDVVHPQQERQLGIDKKQNATALASVSLYKPTMIFEFSCSDPSIDWKKVENIFWKAIAFGVGGKTSTGYGMGGYNDQRPAAIPSSKASVALVGQGVSPTLRSDEPEFRPNLFKASLRGHLKRLLGGVSNDAGSIDKKVERLFGSSSDVGALKIFWEQKKDVVYDDFGQTKTFKTEGILYFDASQEDVGFMEQVLKFAFVMGGFGKSWRRASHQLFHRTYTKFEIGCHWQFPSVGDLNWLGIKSSNDLAKFLQSLHDICKQKFEPNQIGHQSWREAWHPDRLTVFAKVTKESSAIELFHNPTFKTTPAIGGRNPHREHPQKTKPPEFFSHVWHRMLPIGNGQYLEIVTVFHSQRDKWKHQNSGDQLKPFLDAIAENGLVYVWGNQNPLQEKLKLKLKN